MVGPRFPTLRVATFGDRESRKASVGMAVDVRGVARAGCSWRPCRRPRRDLRTVWKRAVGHRRRRGGGASVTTSRAICRLVSPSAAGSRCRARAGSESQRRGADRRGRRPGGPRQAGAGRGAGAARRSGRHGGATANQRFADKRRPIERAPGLPGRENGASPASRGSRSSAVPHPSRAPARPDRTAHRVDGGRYGRPLRGRPGNGDLPDSRHARALKGTERPAQLGPEGPRLGERERPAGKAKGREQQQIATCGRQNVGWDQAARSYT